VGKIWDGSDENQGRAPPTSNEAACAGKPWRPGTLQCTAQNFIKKRKMIKKIAMQK